MFNIISVFKGIAGVVVGHPFDTVKVSTIKFFLPLSLSLLSCCFLMNCTAVQKLNWVIFTFTSK